MKLKSGFFQAERLYKCALCQYNSTLTIKHFQQKRGYRNNCRPPDYRSQRFCELIVCYNLRGCQIKDPFGFRMFQYVQISMEQVVQMNPREALISIADTPTKTQSENRE